MVTPRVADGRGFGIPSEGPLWDTIERRQAWGQTPLGTGITTLRKQTRIKIREYTNGHSSKGHREGGQRIQYFFQIELCQKFNHQTEFLKCVCCVASDVSGGSFSLLISKASKNASFRAWVDYSVGETLTPQT